MNEHDFLDAIGDIKPEHVDAADRLPNKKRSVLMLERYLLAAAVLALVAVSWGVVRNGMPFADSPTTEEVSVESAPKETAEVTEGEDAEEEALLMTAKPESVEESDAVAETEAVGTADYPAMLVVGGAVFKDTGIICEDEVDESAAQKVSSYVDGEPSADGEQNFDRSLETRYVQIDDEIIAVNIDGEWRMFERIEE